MKIISKFKDYYDYLQSDSFFGTDPKIVLDRTDFTISPDWQSYRFTVAKFIFYICDYHIEVLCDHGVLYHGENIKNCPGYKSEDQNYYYIKDYRGTISIRKKPILLKPEHSPNIKYNCPILLTDWGERCLPHPILKDYNFSKLFPATEIWTLISNWLSQEKEIVNNQTDKEKISSHGFDLKTSFRNPVNKRKK